MLRKEYMIGHPTVLVGDQVTLPITSYFGFALVAIDPPGNVRFPVLPVKANGKLLFPLCRTCAHTMNKSPCTHTTEERRLTGQWTTLEVSNYKIYSISIFSIT